MKLLHLIRAFSISLLLTLPIVSCSQHISIFDYFTVNYPETMDTTASDEGDKTNDQKKVPEKVKADTTVRIPTEPKAPPPLPTVAVKSVPTTDNKNFAQKEQPPIPIEERLFKLVEEAYIRRDEVEFTRLSTFFLNSFPDTERRGIIEQFRRSFFYNEKLDVDALKGTLVELSFPESKTWEDLNIYFSKLRQTGIATLQVPVLQLAVIPVYLFAEPQNVRGYYFETTQSSVVDNVLEKLVTLAHNNDLKVYASFPWRNHPLLNLLHGHVMDDSWDPVQSRTYTNGKLDLLNPEGVAHLKLLLNDLVKTEIDGIIFQDDFTYALHEGFANSARSQFRFQTGRNIEVSRFTTVPSSARKGKFEIRPSQELNAYLDWRTGEIRQSLWDIINHLRKRQPDLLIGLELTPGMILNEAKSKRYYSTSMRHLKSLETDFFLLKERESEPQTKFNETAFFQAARKLKSNIKKANSIFLKLELSEATNNIIRLNRKIKALRKMFKKEEIAQIAIGPIDRTENWLFLR